MSGRRWWMALVVLLSVGAAAMWYFRGPTTEQAQEMLRQASLREARGDATGARQLATASLAIDDRLGAAHLLLARLDMADQQWSEALSHLDLITAEQPEWRPARQLTATICHRHVYRLDQAEAAYRDVLSVAPDDPEALEGYAQLLGLCGRRVDAIPLVLRLVRAGYSTDLLMLLSRESGSLTDPQLLEQARLACPEDANPLLGQAMVAVLNLDFPAAVPLLEQVATLPDRPTAARSLQGRVLLASRKYEQLQQWARQLPEDRAAESWFVLSELAEQAGDLTGAARCCWEGLRRRPESLSAVNRMGRLLESLGRPNEAAPFFERVERLNEFRGHQRLAIMSEERPTFAAFLAMVNSYEAVGRHWEALAWGQLALELQPDHRELTALIQRLLAESPQRPLQLTVDAANPALAIDLSEYAVPDWQQGFAAATRQSEGLSSNTAFAWQGADIGFDFQYFAGSRQTTNRMYEFGGGGLGVVDFDQDGWPDVYCSQGELVAPSRTQADRQQYHDALFRNTRDGFRDVSGEAGLADIDLFGQGVAVGDVNADGFADVYVGGTHENRLWLNNGDGTFRSADDCFSSRPVEWTTSCLVADLNGDGHADIYDVNYLAGDRVFERLCAGEHGNTAMCSPYDFDAAVDRVWLSDGAGHFRSAADFLQPPPAGKGLGIVAFNTGDQRMSLFVANDTVANFFYTADSPVPQASVPGSAELIGRMTESALTAGLAFNGDGKAEACMGVAAGDGNGDGELDLLVTNFLHESNTLYSTMGPGVFQDRTRELGLQEPTLPVLGWGTQFLDANLDGRQELFVANGYTHDLSRFDTPYAMRPHLYEFTGQRFERLPIEQLGPWADQQVVARAAAKLDWNRDGRGDLAVGLLEAASGILTNVTETRGHYLSLRLVATHSARDAVGTIVRLQTQEQTYVHQLTGGDGYQASNERRLLMGWDTAQRLQQLEIQWPSGITQTLPGPLADGEWTVVEGRSPVSLPQ